MDLRDFLLRSMSSLEADAQRRLLSNPLPVLDAKSPQTQAILVDAPSIADSFDDGARAHFDGLQQALTDLGQPYRINSRLVRGIDYYTSTVFEWTTTALGAQGTVLAGGRYDGLGAQLGGRPTPAAGWAHGIERRWLL